MSQMWICRRHSSPPTCLDDQRMLQRDHRGSLTITRDHQIALTITDCRMRSSSHFDDHP